MKTRYGVSPWVYYLPDPRRPAYPRLRGEHTVDLLIIGGGLTGCATAYAAAAAGLKVILIERDRIGLGAAGRSAGLLLPEPGPLFRDVAQAHGLRSARRVFDAWRRASLDAAALVRRLKLRAGLEPLATLTVASNGGDNVLRREFEARREAGADLSWLTSRQLAASTTLVRAGAMKQRDAFGVNPYRACVGLASSAAARGALLHERTAATKVRFNRKNAQVTTPAATITAGRVAVTTGSATSEYAQLRRHFKQRETYLVLTAQMPAAVRKQVGSRDVTFRDLNRPRHRVRWTSDDRILIAGGDQDEPPERHRDAVRVQRTGQLMYELLTMYPIISGLHPEFGWELHYGETGDGLMYIGPHRNYPHHLFALGGATDSVTGAFLAARLMVRAAQGAAEKGDDVFGFTR